MPMNSYAFWLARRGNSSAEYEDASAGNDAAGRYAVADGATESCFAGLWARLLVEGFVNGAACEAEPWIASLPALQEQWDADVRGRNLPWYAEPSVKQGAFATFLGFMLTDSPLPYSGEGPGVRASYHWQAIAVGDTCLFHTRGTALLRAFPLEYSNQFDNAPKLVGSRMFAQDIRNRQKLWADGQGQPGDRLWTMTDALAHWCLAEHEAGGNPWSEMESLLPPSPVPGRGAGGEGVNLPSPSGRGAGGEGNSFTQWIEGLRDSGRLRNDDVTLLAIRL
ncbi:MAG: hypothetical protein WCJ35_15710 [Planctomycetota bacterium]